MSVTVNAGSSSMEVEAGSDQYLTFILSKEEYGVDILRVQEIRGWDGATVIPNTPDYILGVVNLRGTVVPIIDLRVRFEMENTEFTSSTVVVVVKVVHDSGERTVGMVVDAVSDVYNVAAEDVNTAPDVGGSVSLDFIKGLATVNEKMIILLDIDALINLGILEDIAA